MASTSVRGNQTTAGQGLLDRVIRRAGRGGAGNDFKSRLGLLQGWVSVGVNAGIFSLKFSLGLVLGSIALVADSVDSLFDVLGSAIVVFSFYWFRRPRDREHPFGHGRVDLVAGLILAVLLIGVGLELVRSSVVRILHPPTYRAPWWMIAAVGLTVPLKTGLAAFSRKISEQTDSSSLEASYWYLRFDAVTSATVTAGLLLSRWGWTRVDGGIGLFIAGVIIWTGARLVFTRISPLLGEAPTREEVNAIEQTAARLPGVRGVHDLILHKYGDIKLVSFHIEVDAKRSAMDVHDLAEEAEERVERATGCKAIVHVDPVDHAHPAYEKIRAWMTDLMSRDSRLVGYHDLRVIGVGQELRASVDVVVSVDLPEHAHKQIGVEVERGLKEAIRDIREARVFVEAAYTGGALERH